MILRDKNIDLFDQPFPGTKDAFKFDELENIEVLYVSHNMIKDLNGICQFLTLIELNLNFNLISDITPIQELNYLEKLFLNRNKITVIDSLKKLTSLQVVGLFHNEIFN